MLKQRVVKIEKIENFRVCDVCETSLESQIYSHLKCENCQKDLCSECIGHENYTDGDYREVYCVKCWNIGKKYREEIKKLEDKIEKLGDDWRAECL